MSIPNVNASEITLRYKPNCEFYLIWAITTAVFVISYILFKFGQSVPLSALMSFKLLTNLSLIYVSLGFVAALGFTFGGRYFSEIRFSKKGISRINFSFFDQTAPWELLVVEPLRYLGTNGLMVLWRKKRIWISSKNENFEAAVQLLQKRSLLDPGNIKYVSWTEYQRKIRTRS